jgi:hypothetical protein
MFRIDKIKIFTAVEVAGFMGSTWMVRMLGIYVQILRAFAEILPTEEELNELLDTPAARRVYWFYTQLKTLAAENGAKKKFPTIPLPHKQGIVRTVVRARKVAKKTYGDTADLVSAVAAGKGMFPARKTAQA